MIAVHPQRIDLTGRQFGNWRVAGNPRIRNAGKGVTWEWECRCLCGVVQHVLASNLTSGGSTKCKTCQRLAMRKPKPLAGRVFGRLKVLDNPQYIQAEVKGGHWRWDVECECGRTDQVLQSSLIRNRRSCCRWCVDHGRILTNDQETEVCSLYLSGLSTPAIATRIGIERGLPLAVLQRHRIARRDPSAAHRRLPLNQAAFATPLTEEAAYWVGFLLADGTVSGATVKLGLAPIDRGHVERFRDFLGSGHKLQFEPPKPAALPGSTGLVSLAFNSPQVRDDLARYGVSEKKSLTANPTGGVENMPSMWRGLVDGDGWVSINKRGRPVIGLVGSYATIKAFIAFARQQGVVTRARPAEMGKIWQTSFSCRNGALLIKSLYANDAVALERKREVGLRAVAEYEKDIVAVAASRICSVAGCGRVCFVKPHCKKHWRRLKKTGSPNLIGRRKGHSITWNGETRDLHEWARFIGIHASTLSARLRLNWSVERALTTPLNTQASAAKPLA